MKKCPSSVWCWDWNSQHLEHKSPPITTRTGLPPKCCFIIKTGMYKGLPCDHSGIKFEHGIFCDKHVKYNINSIWSPEKEQLFKSKSVPELKAMLKSKGLKVGGVKKELVNRLFAV